MLWSRPEFMDQVLAATQDEAAKHEGHDDRVVELPSDRNEVWDEVDRSGSR